LGWIWVARVVLAAWLKAAVTGVGENAPRNAASASCVRRELVSCVRAAFSAPLRLRSCGSQVSAGGGAPLAVVAPPPPRTSHSSASAPESIREVATTASGGSMTMVAFMVRSLLAALLSSAAVSATSAKCRTLVVLTTLWCVCDG
jgi:hypothetical protein